MCRGAFPGISVTYQDRRSRLAAEAFLRRDNGGEVGAHRGLRDAVLRDVEAHTRGAPREDDQTVLVLRVP